MDVLNTQIIILAGGKGSCLSSVLSDIPKPMAPIKDRPFLEYQIQHLKKYGFKHFCISTGYKADIIRDYFKDGEQLGIDITYSHEESPLGTGGAIKKAINSSNYQKFLVLNGDTYFSGDPTILMSRSEQGQVTIALKYIEENTRYGFVKIDNLYRVTGFDEKKELGSEGYINAGMYYLTREIESVIPDGKVSIETEVFPLLNSAQVLVGVPIGGRFIDIGIPEDYDIAQDKIPTWINSTPMPCLFLDRDGVIVEDTKYLSKPEDVSILPGIADLIYSANQKGWKVIVVTNQAGIGRGYFTEDNMNEVNERMLSLLKKENGIIDKIYYCPFHPTKGQGKYRLDSLLRKPNPGMILKAMEEFDIDIKKSVMVGDKTSDNINTPCLKTYLLRANYSLEAAPADIEIRNSIQEIKNSIFPASL